jgi:hypothetical protein
MHYIIGTSFSIRPDPRRGFIAIENQFKINMPYRLTNIILQKENNTLVYTFDGMDQSRVILNFNNSKDADMFIAKLRNEQLPDYSKNLGKIDV